VANISTLTEEEFNERIKFRNDVDEFCCDCYHWWVMDRTFGQCRCLSPILIDKKHGAVWPETAPNFGCSDFASFDQWVEGESDEDNDDEWVIVQQK